MPNGDPTFNLEEQEAWFDRIAEPINLIVAEHGLILDKYYHEGSSWDLRFSHPLGGNASIEVMNAGDVVRLSTIWYLDDYDQFTRFLHRRDPIDVELLPDSISNALLDELDAILATPLDKWTQSATGYEDVWGKFSKSQFTSMGRSFPLPKSLQGTDQACVPPSASGRGCVKTSKRLLRWERRVAE